MKKEDYAVTITVSVSASEVFDAINSVSKWWTEDLEGSSKKLSDVFTVTFDDMHVSKQKLIEIIQDKKVVWLVADSNLSFIKNKKEWTGTTISFEIIKDDNKTHMKFIHHGLVPEIECYNSCTKGWDYFIKGSLFKLLTEGKGTPGL